MNTYAETRNQLLRRGALGEDVAAEIEALDEDVAAQEKAKKLSSDIAGARTQIEREAAQKRLQQAHGDAVAMFRDLQEKANKAAAHAETLVEQAKAACQEWKEALEAARAQSTQVHALRMQGAKPVQMPVALGGDRYSLHLLRDAGVQYHQQILHDGKLPRIA